MITIKGRKFSEDTIVAALKAHTDWPEEEKVEFKAGDVVQLQSSIGNEGIRLVIKQGSGLATVTKKGDIMDWSPSLWGTTYKKLGRCDGFELEIPFEWESRDMFEAELKRRGIIN